MLLCAKAGTLLTMTRWDIYIYIFGLHHSPSGLKLAAQLGHLEVARNLVLQQDGIERMYVVQAAVFRPSAWRR